MDRNGLGSIAAAALSLGRIFGVVVVVAGIAGCATQAAPEAKGESAAAADAVVMARAKDRWQALITGDIAKAYEYLSPGSKAVYSLEVYRNGIRTGFWKAAEVEKVECAADLCEVTTALTYVYSGMTVKTPAKESWIREKGVWWYLHKS